MDPRDEFGWGHSTDAARRVNILARMWREVYKSPSWWEFRIRFENARYA